ncbi:MFS transporter [Streptomyces sp. SID8379]|uniref:MFS transporter n=1 Tax=unclassified Streptomyces TaxID=2593676 RepID=UPI0003A56CCD|nr:MULTISPECIES: MFS transporter [unclassified Streptomyces]MYW64235.1 MFS transporter [Streptomyces sp. SID8379]
MTTAPVAATATDPELPRQRRVLTVLVISQVIGGLGLTAGITVGALIAEDMLGSTGLAGVPALLFAGGSAAGAAGIGRLCQLRGRRPGLAAGYAAAAVGSLGVVTAAVADSPVLLLIALTVYGAGTAAHLLSRYAGADLAAPERRGRAMSTVLFATTLGAVAGPFLADATGEVAHQWHVPRLAGPFLLAAVAYALAAAVLVLFLRPDPLPPARAAAPEPADTAQGTARAGLSRGLLLGAAAMALAQLVMIAVMTMTPVHLRAHGHGTQAAGLVIALHVGAMFLPSPLTGLLVDRIGGPRVLMLSALVLLAAGAGAAAAPLDSLPAVAASLVLLGLGWNLGLIGGTAVVTAAVPPAHRAAAQGLADVGVAVAGATGGMASGLVVAASGYAVLAAGGAALALALVPVAFAVGVLRPPPRFRTAEDKS